MIFIYDAELPFCSSLHHLSAYYSYSYSQEKYSIYYG